MDAAPSPRHAGTLAGLTSIAIAGLIVLFAIGPTSPRYVFVRGVVAAVAFVTAGIVIRGATPRSGGWPGGRRIGLAFLLLGGVAAVFSTARASSGGLQPHVADVVLLGLLVPFILAAGDEFQAHFTAADRREVSADVLLLTASIAAILYVVIRPIDASTPAGVAAATYAILAAAMIAVFGALALWASGGAHLFEFGGFAALALATLQVGAVQAAGGGQPAPPWVGVVYLVTPLILAAVLVYVPHDAQRLNATGTRLARPVLTSITVMAACLALSIVAILDDARGIAGPQSTVILLVLGTGIALRILANQLASAEAHEATRIAMQRQELALHDKEAALERVRDTNTSLRESEERLRLVFEGAVDGFVELDHHGHVIRANDAFARMTLVDPVAIVGMSWFALTATIDGADPAFARLVEGGTATIERSDGQVIHLESTVSAIPTTPPRSLLLVRDVTAAKVADQTIRSLFHFLQDRDEDRTRLLRRSNAAIEQERNRIARDLHDGPVQGVSAASLSLEAALLMIKAGDAERGMDVLVKVRQELASEADALRRLMSGLRPPVLEERGLMPALRETLSRFGIDTGIVATFEGELGRPIPRDVETLAYRVVQEALTNVGKHAEATTVLVQVEIETGQLRTEIEDDGRGFETSHARDYLRSGRVGLASMRERVELAGGTFTLRSSPGRGTVVTALIPVDESLLVVPAI
ncbi:MAG TPA: PAS domain-containing sensor histidine kinase [Actinomycetota bacterium]|nr:PAS domain-containing sensor histidine kinase [Actinomycetota bacterium]